MRPKKTIAGALTALALAGGGSAVTLDNQIDPYTEKASSYEVLIEGETVEISKDRPEIKLNRWGGEEGLTVKKTGNYGEAKRGWFSRQQKWQNGNEGVIVEPLKRVEGKNVAEAETQGEEGFKIDILLDEKPDTNVFTLELEGWEDLDFFYQAELTPEEIAEGASRPENVVGSYAVYHKTKANHVLGKTNYMTGKLYHIYRPKVLDSEGNWVWGQLEIIKLNAKEGIPQELLESLPYPLSFNENYEAMLLVVRPPQDFLDTASYPVRVDPTFGYTSAGGSGLGYGSVSTAIGNIVNQLTATAGDTITSFSISASDSAGPDGTISFAAYTVVSGNPDARLAARVNVAINALQQWFTTATVSQAMSAGSTYSVAISSEDDADAINIYFDAGVAPGRINSTLTTLAASFSPTGTDSGRHYSWYATYTASAGGAAPARKTAPIMIESD